MSIKAMTAVWDSGIQDQSELLVLLALADWSNDEGVCWPSMQTLSKKSRLSLRKTQYVVRRLQSEEILSVTVRRGRTHTNLYKLNLHSMHLLSKKACTDKTCTDEQENMHGKTGKYARMVHPEPPKPDPSKNHHQVSGDLVEKLLAGTVFHGADLGKIINAAKKNARSQNEIEMAISVLENQYRHDPVKMKDPTGTSLLIGALKDIDSIRPSKGYIPRSQREAEAEQRREAANRKADEERRAKETEDSAFREAEAKLFVLPKEERDGLFTKAKNNLPSLARNSLMAVKCEAIRMMMSKITQSKK